MNFTDTHCHLDFPELAADQSSLYKLLASCAQHNIHRIIVPSVSPENWQKTLTLAAKSTNEKNSPDIYAALGMHPWYVHQCQDNAIDDLRATIVDQQGRAGKIVAIGEAGIDLPMAEKYNNLDQQTRLFAQQITLAQELALPLIIHHRRSHNEIISLLKNAKFNLGGIMHAFSGSYQQAMQYIDLGFKLGIGGTITYPRATKTINAIKRLPLSALVLETDAPAMPLYGFQGQSNSPLKINAVFEALRQIRSESPEQIALQIEQNVSEALPLLNAGKPS